MDYCRLAEQCHHSFPPGDEVFEFGYSLQEKAQEEILRAIEAELSRRQRPESSCEDDWEGGIKADIRSLRETYQTFLKEEAGRLPVGSDFDNLPPFERRAKRGSAYPVHARTIGHYAALPGLRLFRALRDRPLVGRGKR